MSPELYDKVGEVQAAVNSEHTYKSDASGYGLGDYWDFMSPGDTGDCEDFALTKMQELLNYGVGVKNLQLMICEVETGQHHAVLAIQTSNRGTLILDNRYGSVMQIGNVPYRFYAYQSAGTDFKSYTTRLEAIPVEYMNCNAAAFADGDGVVVEFTGQDWSQSKVIGFKSNPESCGIDYYLVLGNAMVADSIPNFNHYFYNASGDSWLGRAFIPSVVDWPSSDVDWSRWCPGYGTAAGYHFVFGGIKMAPWNLDHGTFPYPNLNSHTNVNTAYRYDRTVDAWEEKTSFTSPARNDQACFSISLAIHLVGGTEYQHNTTEPNSAVYSEHDRYDSITDSYSAKAIYKVCRSMYWTLDGLGYVYGGNIVNMGIDDAWNSDNWTDKLKEYDPDTNIWTQKKPASVRSAGAGWSLPGNGYAFGGIEDSWWMGILSEWNKAANTWQTKTPFPNSGYPVDERPAVGAYSFAYAHSNDQTQGLPSNDHWKWTKETDAWSLVGATAPIIGKSGQTRAVL
jgi:hypothetical protein